MPRRKRAPKTEAAEVVARRGGPRTGGRLQRTLDAAAKAEICSALAETKGHVSGAAKLLGLSRPSLWERMTAYKIDAAVYRVSKRR